MSLNASQIELFDRLYEELEPLLPANRDHRLAELAATSTDGTVLEYVRQALGMPLSLRHLPLGTKCGDCELLELIGTGGHGVVYRAKQSLGTTKRHVAVKFITVAAVSGLGGVDELLKQFQEEAGLLAELDHPGIVDVHRTGSFAMPSSAIEVPYIVMDYVDGEPLDKAARNLTIVEKVRLFIKVCEAVLPAQAKGMLHLDLKPQNILVRRMDHQPVILDFGLARIFDPAAPCRPDRFGQGTTTHMAPEQIDPNLGDADFLTDVYALGVVLFQLLTDRLPHEVRSEVQCDLKTLKRKTMPLKICQVCSSLDKRLERIVDKALKHDKSARFQSAAEFASALENWIRLHAFKRWKHRIAACLILVSLLLVVFYFALPAFTMHRVNAAMNRFGWKASYRSSSITLRPFTMSFKAFRVADEWGAMVLEAPKASFGVFKQSIALTQPTLTIQIEKLSLDPEVILKGLLTDDWELSVEDGSIKSLPVTSNVGTALGHFSGTAWCSASTRSMTYRMEKLDQGLMVVSGEIKQTIEGIDSVKGSLKIELDDFPIYLLTQFATLPPGIHHLDGFVTLKGEYAFGNRNPINGASDVELMRLAVHPTDPKAEIRRADYVQFRHKSSVSEMSGARVNELELFELRGLSGLGIDLTPLFQAIAQSFFRTTVSTLEAKPPSQEDQICMAAQAGELETLKARCNQVTNLDFSDKYGRTPLLHAIASRSTECARWLLENHTSPDTMGVGGVTPLILASGINDKPLVELLIQCVASASVRKPENRENRGGQPSTLLGLLT